MVAKTLLIILFLLHTCGQHYNSAAVSQLKPRLHQIHVAVYMYPSAFYSRIQVHICRPSRDDNFVADSGYACRRAGRRQGIQVDTTCIRATCIRCHRCERGNITAMFLVVPGHSFARQAARRIFCLRLYTLMLFANYLSSVIQMPIRCVPQVDYSV